MGAATAAAYLIGSGRVFGYDAAVTFANFIATPSLLDSFAVSTQQPTIPLAQIAGNDHVLISFFSHVIYSLTGTRSEIVYRAIPALAAGGVVGVSTEVIARKFGLVAGACAGLYIATNPMFVDNSRDLRGYSLATLCGLVATVLYFGPRTKWRLVLYGTLMGLAISAHLYTGLILVAHVLWVVVQRSWGDLRVLLPAWVLASAIAIAANGYILWVDVTRHGFPPKLYDPAFPRDVLFYLLGAPSLLTIGLWLSAFGLGLWALRRENRVWASVLLVMAAVGLLWQVVQPSFLYPRFFVFVIPAVAYVLAAAIQRWKLLLAPAVLLGAIAAAVSQVPDYMTDPLALRQAAAVIARADAAGERACLIHSDEQVMGAYAASGFRVVSTASDLASCDLVVVVSWGVDIPLRDLAASEFPRRTLYPAYYPTVVLER